MADDLSSQHARDQLTARIDDLTEQYNTLHTDYRGLLEHVNELIDRIDDVDQARLRAARLAARTLCHLTLLTAQWLLHRHGDVQIPPDATPEVIQALAGVQAQIASEKRCLDRTMTDYQRTEVAIQASANPVGLARTFLGQASSHFAECRPGETLMRAWGPEQIEAYEAEQPEP